MKPDPESARLCQLQLMQESFDIQDRLRVAYPQKDYGILKVSRREYKHPADIQIVIVGECLIQRTANRRFQPLAMV
jgi:hypothetical protein